MTTAAKTPTLDAPRRYKPIRELGSGGGGEVWEVEDRLTGVHLALKLIVGHGGQRETDALVREVVALSGVEGLGLPRVVRFGRLPQSQRVYMLREMVDGRSLDRVLAENPRAALKALAEAADQLTGLHRAGLLHGDIKPANIIVRKGGGATLVDLGLVAPWMEQGVLPEGLTPRYAAPELLQGRPMTVRAEIFSLGLVLDEILEQKKTNKALSAPVVEVLRRVATTATNFEPSSRYPSADEFASELRSGLGMLPSQSSSHELRVSWPILGMDATAARLLTAVAELPAGAVLQLVGPEGAGRSAMLRRLAWSLGITGVSLAYLDEVSVRIPEAALAELTTEGDAQRLVCLVDDADQLSPTVLARLMAIREAGGRLVWVAAETLDATTTLFPVPPLTHEAASELMRRAIPSLTDEMVTRLIQATSARPGALRGLVQRVAVEAVASLPDLERLLEDTSTHSQDADAPNTPERILGLLERGRYREVEAAILTMPAEQASSPVMMVARGRLLLGLGEPQKALQLLEQAVALGESADESVRGSYLVCLARARLGVGDYAGTLAAVENVSVDGSPLAIEGAIQRGLACWYTGHRERARAVLEGAREESAALGHDRLSAVALAALGLVAQREDRLDDALRFYQEAIVLGRSANDAGLLVTVQLNLAGLLKMRGDLAGAIEHFEVALDLGHRTGRHSTVCSALLNLANVELYLGRLARARSRLDELSAQRLALSPKLEAQLCGLQAELAARMGQAAEAVELYDQCSRTYELMGRSVDAAEALLEGILVLARDPGADPAAPISRLERARESLGDSPAHRPLLHVAEGRVAMLMGDESRARTALEQAVMVARETNQKEWLWRALEARSELESRSGRRMRARRDHEEALTVLEEIGAELPRDLREVYWNDPRRGAIRASIAESSLTQGTQSVQGVVQSPVAAAELKTDVSTMLSTPLEMRLAKILEINAELVGELDLERLTERIIDYAMRLVRAERGLVLLRSAEGGLQIHCSRGAADSAHHRQFSSTIADTVVQTGEPVVSVNARDDVRMASWGSVHDLELQSVACLPIRAGRQRVIGALYLETRVRRGSEFGTELPMLQAFSDQVAIAIHNAQLIGENQRRAEELAVANQQLRDAHAKLEESLGNRTAQLERTRKRLRETRETLLGHFGYHGLVGTSAAMRRVYSIIDRVRDTEIPVLITGESGTGKEMVARALHTASPRAKRRFVGVNCGAIPENLLESELFGCVRGAFTGADRDRKGLFRESEGGTILLDEIGEMPQKMQAGLLRVLQEHRVRPVGGSHEEPVDIRLVFATHRDLSRLVEEGLFREDLYYRIRVVDLCIPPLRERREDIPQLVDYFLGIFAARYRREKKSISREALRLLMAQPWRGNVRELEHALLNAWVLSDSDDLGVEDFEIAVTSRAGSTPASAVSSHHLPPKSDHVAPPSSSSKKARGAETERRRILDALASCGQNRVRAALQLGIPRRTFYRRLKEFGIE